MRARFKGEADGLPCEVFGLVFPVGEWVELHEDAGKLVGNPVFEVEGQPEPARNPFDHDGDGRVGGGPKGGLRKAPEPEPDPEADEDPPAPTPVVTPKPAPLASMTDDELRAELKARGIAFHHKAGHARLQALLDEANGGGA